MTSRAEKPNTNADDELKSHIDGRVSFVMVAGAGSGKTTSLVKALAHIAVAHGNTLRTRNQQVACITYTEIARDEIWKDVGEDPLFHVSTIHSFIWIIIRPFRNDIRDWVKFRIQERIDEAQAKIDKKGTRQITKDAAALDIARLQEQLGKMAGVASFRYGTGSDYVKGVLGHDDIIKLGPYLITEKPLMRAIVAQMFPFIFVDESQDTLGSVVSSLTLVQQSNPGANCLGFFGDQLQKIYLSGIGEIPVKADWVKVEKPENFRCPPEVLKVINRIRLGGDTLEQVTGRTWERPGRARMFIAARGGDRNSKLQEIRNVLSTEHQDTKWLSDEREGGVRMLVIVHRMAAHKLGFSNLFSAFNDSDASASLEEGFQKGDGWPEKQFLDYLMPLVKAHDDSDGFSVISKLKKNSPLFEEENLKSAMNARELLSKLKTAVSKLSELLHPNSTATVEQVIRFADENRLLTLDRRWARYLNVEAQAVKVEADDKEDVVGDDGGTDEEPIDKPTDDKAIRAYLAVSVSELFGYQKYVAEQSPFATQHGIKGSEFERVLTVLDDEEGKYNLYSYDKYFGIVPLSDKDQENIDAGKDSVIDRTRRLFYVSCSRATEELAVVLFANDTAVAQKKVVESKIFEEDQIRII